MYYDLQSMNKLNATSLALYLRLCSIFSVLVFPVLNTSFILSLFITPCSMLSVFSY